MYIHRGKMFKLIGQCLTLSLQLLPHHINYFNIHFNKTDTYILTLRCAESKYNFIKQTLFLWRWPTWLLTHAKFRFPKLFRGLYIDKLLSWNFQTLICNNIFVSIKIRIWPLNLLSIITVLSWIQIGNNVLRRLQIKIWQNCTE